MTLLYPYLLAAPLLFLLGFIPERKKSSSVLHPQTSILHGITPSWKLRFRKPSLLILSAMSLVLLALAAARPQEITTLLPPTESRNIILTLDLSGSMGQRDFQTGFGRSSRLEAVKSVVMEFIKARPKDKIGIVIFGTQALLQAPLTLDHDLLVEMVKRLQVGLAGEDTAIGDGLGLSLKRIKDIEGSSKAVILLTDGANHAGEVNPLKAAQIAKDLGVKVHTIGIGSREPFRGGGPFSLQPAQVEFDEETLKRIAEITTGTYFNANTLEGLKQVYSEIDKLETSKGDDITQRIANEKMPIFSGAALLCYLILLILGRSVFLKVPN